MRVPSSTPAGIFTASVRSRVTRPEPAHDAQGLSIDWPRPWQFGQVRSRVKNPRGMANPALAAAGRTGFWLGAGLGAGAGTGLAGHRGRNADLRILAGER